MEIRFEGIDPAVEIRDYVIRQLNIDEDGEQITSQPYFQAHIYNHGAVYEASPIIMISYYDQSNKFLGLDEPSVWSRYWMSVSEENRPLPLSVPLNIPDATAYAVFRLKFEKAVTGGFFHWAACIFTVLVLLVATMSLFYLLKALFF